MRRQESGRTLAELLVTLTISGVLFTLLATAFIGHERLVSGTTAIAETRAQTRQAQLIVPALLGAVAPNDLYAVHDSLADFSYPIAVGVACLSSATSQIMLAPDSVSSGQAFAARTHTPLAGDLVHIFDAGALPSASDDKWWSAAVGGLATVPNGCAGSALLDPLADALHTAHGLTVSWLGPVPASISQGAIVRFSRRTRAQVYAASGGAFLGVNDFNPLLGRWSGLQPVSGPYVSQVGAPGVQFRLLDSLGALLAPTASPGDASMLALHIRTHTASKVRITGMRQGIRAESLSAHIALRSR
jgi:hypothetical protein